LGGAGSAAEEEVGTSEVSLDRIRPNPNQPRETFDSDLLEELRDSIRAHGVLQPICLRSAGDGFEIVSGERRWRAARLAGLRTIPAVVRPDVDDAAMLELALVENLQRQDLNPLEKARGYRDLMQHLGVTQEQVAAKVGIKRASVANHLRLLDLPQEVQEAVASGLVSMGHAKALLGLPDAEAMGRLLGLAVRQDLSVRALEEKVRIRAARQPDGRAKGKTSAGPPPWAAALEARMRAHLGTKVEVKIDGAEAGRIVVHYHDRPELDRLTEVLGPRQEL
jgi:ParB family chromosome partitioning protein